MLRFAAMAASQLHQNASFGCILMLPKAKAKVNIIALQLCNPTGYINALHLCLPVRAFALAFAAMAF